MRMSDKRVVLTGGAQGIGLAAAHQLAAEGAAVVLLDSSGAALAAAVEAITAAGGVVHGFLADVRDAVALRGLAAQIENEIGPVDGLVTCAGITHPAPAVTMPTDVWRKVLDVNLDGTFFACQAFAAGMIERRQGSIVTITSASGLGGQSGRANYVASKWAVIGLSKSLAIEWAQHGIRVNTVAPGPVDTALYRKLPDSFREQVVNSRTPMGRAADAEELSPVIAFLLSEEARFVTGIVMPVDGGYTSGYSIVNGGRDLVLSAD